MTSKKPWKPYDVEQAKADILAEAARRLEVTKDAINEAAINALKRLEEEAKTFAQMPKDVGSLFSEASAVMIGAYMPAYDREVEIGDLVGFTRGDGQFVLAKDMHVKVPAKKHRVLVFFIPEE